jgi:hypothetical protein
MLSFSDYVQGHAMTPVELPLVHTTDCFRLGSIQESHALQPRSCGIFNEPLLYFFYGRPAYRDSSCTNPVREIGFYPICFVIRPGTLSRKLKRLYPFDTGASQKGLYEPAITPSKALVTYEVLATLESARRIVGGFFEIAENYLSNKPRFGLLFGPDEADANSYYQLISGGGHPDCDDRCSAIEVQIGESLDLSGGVLMAVVLPTCFLDDAALRSTLVKIWRAQPLTYDADLGMRPLEFHGIVRHLVRGFYRNTSLI